MEATDSETGYSKGFVFIVAMLTVIPLLAHALVVWWLGLLLGFGSLMIYDKLFVAPGALCMGIPFMFPMAALHIMIIVDLARFCRWIF